MPIPCNIRVLVVDNDVVTRNQVIRMLKNVGYYIVAAEGKGVELANSAKKLAISFKPHVVIMDLRLSDEHADDRSGLELWKDSGFFSARCILYSAFLNENYKITREALRQEGVEDVIGKEDPPQDLISAVERVARKGCSCQKGFSVNWPTAWSEEAVINCLYKDPTVLPSELVVDVFGRLFPETNSLTLKALEGTTKSSVAVARGRAVLFQATQESREPVVVKLAPRERIQVEAAAYKEFIQDRLVGQFYARLKSRADFWDLGGICYSFIGSSLNSIETFASFYCQTRNSQEIIKPLEHFFEEVWRRHYSGTHPALTENLVKAYDSFLKIRGRLEAFPVQGKTVSFSGLPGTYPNPAVWILAHEADSFFPSARQAVTHGDLHGDNLFVEKDHAWAIDFERSGMGHILRDFVELEEDILTRLIVLPGEDLRPFYYLIISLIKPISPLEQVVLPKYFEQDEEMRKAAEVINALRAIAYSVTRYENMQEYYWGLLLDAFFSLKLAEPLSPKWGRGLLLASLLCARLREWGRAWPSGGWPTINDDLTKQLNEMPTHLQSMPSQGKGNGGTVTNISIGNITIGDGASMGNIVLANEIQKSFNKAESADIQIELKQTLKQLAAAVDKLNKFLPEEQASEAAEDLFRLVDEATKPTPRKKWYSISVDGLIKAAENVEKVGEPVINLSKKVLSILTGGIISS